MKPISDRYAWIFKEYYGEKAADRFDFVARYASEFGSVLPFREKVDTSIDFLAIDAFVTSYFLDVIKFKEYHFYSNGLYADRDGEHDCNLPTKEFDKKIHEGKLLNSSKVGAFTAKWLLKYHPLLVTQKPDAEVELYERRHIQNIPFIVACNIALRAMGIEPDEVPSDLYRSLVYHLRFRTYEDRSMIMYFELLVAHIELLRDGAKP